jgi:SAM-dependent methyltransferase
MRTPVFIRPGLTALLVAGCAAHDRSNPPPAFPASAQNQTRSEGHATGPGPSSQHELESEPHRFDDAERWARVFEDPARDAWQRPEQVIVALRIPRGARVADVGAATGYFPVRIARAHPDATVYGVDIEPNLVAFLRARADREKLSNLRTVLATPADPKLPEPVDLVLLVDTYHHLEDRPTYFANLAWWLRPGGRVAIVDFRKGSRIGPPEHHKIAEQSVIAEMNQAGYRLAENHDFLPHQYFLVFAIDR